MCRENFIGDSLRDAIIAALPSAEPPETFAHTGLPQGIREKVSEYHAFQRFLDARRDLGRVKSTVDRHALRDKNASKEQEAGDTWPPHVYVGDTTLAVLAGMAVKLGDTDALYHLGEHYFLGTGVQFDPAKAERVFALAEAAGHPKAAARLSLLRLSFSSAAEARAACERWRSHAGTVRSDEVAGAGGSSQATSTLAVTDISASASASASAGIEMPPPPNDPRARYFLHLHLNGPVGVREDRSAAAGLLEAAARQGLAVAMHDLAVLHLEGALGKPDDISAARWLMRAARQGDARSRLLLAILLATGIGLPRDVERAARLFASAAVEQPLARIVAASPAIVQRWHDDVASSSSRCAYNSIGLARLTGLCGVEPDANEARRLFKSGAAASCEPAVPYYISNLAARAPDAATVASWSHTHDVPVDKNIEVSRAWAAAAAAGCSEAVGRVGWAYVRLVTAQSADKTVARLVSHAHRLWPAWRPEPNTADASPVPTELLQRRCIAKVEQDACRRAGRDLGLFLSKTESARRVGPPRPRTTETVEAAAEMAKEHREPREDHAGTCGRNGSERLLAPSVPDSVCVHDVQYAVQPLFPGTTEHEQVSHTRFTLTASKSTEPAPSAQAKAPSAPAARIALCLGIALLGERAGSVKASPVALGWLRRAAEACNGHAACCLAVHYMWRWKADDFHLWALYGAAQQEPLALALLADERIFPGLVEKREKIPASVVPTALGARDAAFAAYRKGLRSVWGLNGMRALADHWKTCTGSSPADIFPPDFTLPPTPKLTRPVRWMVRDILTVLGVGDDMDSATGEGEPAGSANRPWEAGDALAALRMSLSSMSSDDVRQLGKLIGVEGSREAIAQRLAALEASDLGMGQGVAVSG